MNGPIPEFAELRPRFRTDLEIISTPGQFDAPPAHFVRDPGTGKVYELGEVGAFLCRRMDGRTSPAELMALAEGRFGSALTLEELLVFTRQVGENGLLQGTDAARRERTFAEICDPDVFLPLGQWRFMRGDRFLGLLARSLAWCFSVPFHIIAGAIVLGGMWITVTHFWELVHAAVTHWSTGFFLLILGVAAFVIQSPRSLVHGILCKRYGRQVTGIGLALIYYMLPVLYCEWSDVMWIRERSKRFWTIVAGIYFQILTWAVATIAWHYTIPRGYPNTFWLATALVAGGGLILINGNPLVQMDGYLLFSSWVDVPFLRRRALAVFGSWVSRRPEAESLTRREWRWFCLYGGLAFAYALFHLVIHLWAFWNLLTPEYHGLGALFTVLLGIYLTHKPLGHYLAKFRVIHWLFGRNAGRLAWGLRSALLAGLVVVAFLPYPYQTGGAFQFLPTHRIEVRSEVEGLIEEILVKEGQWVEAGQPIARLTNRVQQRNLDAADAQLAKARAQLALGQAGVKPEEIESARAALRTAETRFAWSAPRATRFTLLSKDHLVSDQALENAFWQRDLDRQAVEEARATLKLVQSGTRRETIDVLQAQVRSFEALAANYRTDLERTTLTSPIAGRVVTPHVEEMQGTYLQPGLRDLVATIEDARTIRAEVEVPEEDLEGVRLGSDVRVVTWAFHNRIFHGRVSAIAPVAAPPVGSAVTPVAVVRVITEIPNLDGMLRSEMSGYAKIVAGYRPVWDVVTRPIVRWMQVEGWYYLP